MLDPTQEKTASVGGDLAAVAGTHDRARIEVLNGGLVLATVRLFFGKAFLGELIKPMKSRGR
jgi:hypothetical protein